MSQVPEHVVDKQLWRRIRTKTFKEIPQNSAYRSGILIRRYKEAGGRFKGKKPTTGISRWFCEKWIDVDYWLKTKKQRPCGVEERCTKYCRPWIRIDSKTPTTVREASRADLIENVKRKKRGERVKVLRRK